MNRPTQRSALSLGSLALIAALAPAPLAPDEAGDLRKLVERRVEISQKIADYYADRRLAPPGERLEPGMNPLGEQGETWTRRSVDAKLDAATGRDERLAILLADVERTKAIEARIKDLIEGERGTARIEAFKAEFYRLDSEYRLAKAKAER